MKVQKFNPHALAESKFEYVGNTCSVMLGLSMTLDEISIFVYVAFDGKLSEIRVCSVNYTGEANPLPRLLCVIYAAIISLATKPITSGDPKLITISAAMESTECSQKIV